MLQNRNKVIHEVTKNTDDVVHYGSCDHDLAH